MPKKIDFDEGTAEFTAENLRRKEKLKHLVLYGEDVSTDDLHIGAHPPTNPKAGQLWHRTSDSTMLLWYIDNTVNRGYWIKTYEK